MRTHLMLVALIASLGSLACPSSPEVAPEASTPPPRGPALARAVEGRWLGVAEDGTATKEGVELTLSQDGTFVLSAGVVQESYRWIVRDDLVILLPDPASEASDGVCFRPTRVGPEHLEGLWTYTVSGVTTDNAACRSAWYPVGLDRRP